MTYSRWSLYFNEQLKMSDSRVDAIIYIMIMFRLHTFSFVDGFIRVEPAVCVRLRTAMINTASGASRK